MRFQELFTELKRRNVFRVAGVYAITAWLLIQIIATVFPILQLPEWSVTLLTVVILIGFPLAIIFAWAFEITPDGIKPSFKVDKEESITSETGKKINKLTVYALSFVILFLLTERIFFANSAIIDRDKTEVGTASIAVLPFVNMSGDEENEYFSDGLSEELLNALAKVEEMKVAGRTSSFKFKGQNDDLKKIGAELGVGHILEGSVRKSNDRIRITAQLISVEDGYHLWSETYDRELNDIFAIQDEISRKVLSELKVRLLQTEEVEATTALPTADIEAYNLFLKATQLEVTRRPVDIQLAIDYYNNAIKLDPNFAKAYARLAIAYELLSGYGSLSDEDRRKLVRENVDKALFIDENSAEAYAALGLFYTTAGEYAQSIEAYEKALELNPNYAIIYSWLANAYINGNVEKAIENYVKAYELDPLDNVAASNYGRALTLQGKTDEALAYYQKRQLEDPTFLFNYYRIAEIYFFDKGELGKAIEPLLKAKQIEPDASFTLSYLAGVGTGLHLLDFAEKVYETDSRINPDNPSLQNSMFYIMAEKRDFESLIDYVENDYMKNYGDEFFDWDLLQITYHAAEQIDRLDLIYSIAEKYYPSLTEDPSNMKMENLLIADLLINYFREKGDQESVNAFIEPMCELADEELKELKEDPEDRAYIYPRLTCEDLRGDKVAFVEAFKKYAELTNTFLLLGENVEYGSLWNFLDQDIPEINKIIDEAYVQFNQERKQAIALLKEYGEWDPAWDASADKYYSRENESK